jgi:hypothetical protein
VPRRLRPAGPRTLTQRWAAAAVAASAIGFIALVAIFLMSVSGRAAPAPLLLMGVLFPAGVGVLLALILTEARRRRQ